MPDRPQQKRSVLVGPMCPVPVSPIFGWYDLWETAGSSVKTWAWTVPNDGMVYKLCNFNHISIPTGFMYVLIEINGDSVWNEYGGYENIWRPTYANAMSLVFPDIVAVSVVHTSPGTWKHYWEMDFWREQAHG